MMKMAAGRWVMIGEEKGGGREMRRGGWDGMGLGGGAREGARECERSSGK